MKPRAVHFKIIQKTDSNGEAEPRHGCYKRDLEYFAERLLERAKVPLIAQAHGD